MKRILFIMAALALVIGLMPMAGVIASNGGEVIEVGNIGFVPNSGEASVSRVDLWTYEEIARYYTAPRIGDEVDLLGNPTPGVPNNIAPLAWRTSRIAKDADDNAWVLNVGADGANLQGSVVRIQADTEGLDTHEYPADVYDFGTDEAVQVFPVGDPGDMPRAIAIDGDGYIWVGFYSGAQLMKYDYDEAAEKLTAVGGPFYPDLTPDNKVIRYYEMKFAPDGTLFISSRDSTPTRTPRQEGIWAMDIASEGFVRETTFNPYSILIAEDGTVYATAYSSILYIRNKDTGVWTSVTITGSSQNRGMGFDLLGRIWIASTVNHNAGTGVYSYDPGTGDLGPNYTLTGGATTPVGVGMDADGNMWVVCRTDGTSAGGYLQGFDPVGLGLVGNIQVGFRPYAYGDFTPTVTVYRICGYKLLAEWDDTTGTFVCTTEGLEGWEIKLEKLNPDTGEWELVVQNGLTNPATTDEFGWYCFRGLFEGTYRVSETPQEGYEQVHPDGDGTHIVTVPGGETNPTTMEPLYNFCNAEEPELYDICGFKYAEWAGDLIPLPGWEIVLEMWNAELEPPDWEEVASTETDGNGAYCFTDLQAGEYRVSETLKPGWDQIYPAGDVYVVHLPNGEDPDRSYDFHNTPKVYCARDTAWAYGGTEADGGAELPVGAPTEDLVVRHNNKVEGNSSNSWGWTDYNSHDPGLPYEREMDLWAGAGQNDTTRGMLVGTVTVSYDDDSDCVTVVYNIHYPHTLLEAHAWIGPTPLPTETVTRGRREVTVVTAAPGQFDKYVEYTSVEMNAQSATFVVCGDDLKLDEAGGFWVAAHAVVEWCEPDPDAWDELEALLPE